jgi:hypothetical protein
VTIDLLDDPTTPIGACLARWHTFLSGDRDALAPLVADGAVLHSPVLFRPLAGRDTVVLYLTAASMSFVGDPARNDDADTPAEPRSFRHPNGGEWDGRFHYVRKVTGTHDAVLEFETVMAGRYVNGVDMITCDDDGLIVDFKVMVRPMQAIDAVRELMVGALDQLGAPPA